MFWTCGVNQTKLNGMFSLAVTGAGRCLKSVTLHEEAKGSSHRSGSYGDDTLSGVSLLRTPCQDLPL